MIKALKGTSIIAIILLFFGALGSYIAGVKESDMLFNKEILGIIIFVIFLVLSLGGKKN